MKFLLHPEFWARWLGIVIIDLSLAGDNALVIAMAVLTLPKRQRLFGLIGGTVGAVLLRIILIAVVTQILLVPYLQAIGGVVLMWIAVKLVRQDTTEEQQRTQRAMIALFLAVLEMVKLQAIVILQKDLFGEIAITRHEKFETVFATGQPINAIEKDYT